jgi:hypothetical protein
MCGLLIALWVRSYSWTDQLSGPLFQLGILQVSSIRGGLVAQVNPHRPGYQWNVDHYYRNRPWVARLPFRFGGEFRRIPNGLTMPHWFLVLVVGSVAAILWTPWSRRFSLRTLLIATTLVAIVLGLMIVAFEK